MKRGVLGGKLVRPPQRLVIKRMKIWLPEVAIHPFPGWRDFRLGIVLCCSVPSPVDNAGAHESSCVIFRGSRHDDDDDDDDNPAKRGRARAIPEKDPIIHNLPRIHSPLPSPPPLIRIRT